MLWSDPAAANPVIYEPQGEANGKTIVFIASDHEYRAEETCPALARILAKHHGFRTVVCFGVDGDGFIEAGASNIQGLEHLARADGAVFFTRFLNLPDEQMKHIDDYLNRAGPVVGLRTATHGFRVPEGSAYAKYDFRFKGEEYLNGFGHQVLGQTWVGHYGRNHRQSTRIDIIPEKKGHPILRGVSAIHVKCGGYNAEPQPDWNILTMAQPLMTMEADGAPDPEKPPKASEWTREYEGKDGKTGRVFTSLYGASQDIENPGYRRMIINGIYWSIGMEDRIVADSTIDFVGEFAPNEFRGGGAYAKGIKPSDYEGFSSRIPLNNNTAKVEKKAAPAPKTGDRKAKKSAGLGVKAPVDGVRFVRVDLPSKEKKPLTLAEVEVFSGGKNVARGGKASQSSVSSGGVPERGIDGNKDQIYSKGGQTHTGFGTDNWWELDLQKDFKVEKVHIWNRKAQFAGRLDGFTLSLLDSNREVLFTRKEVRAPEGSVVFDLAGGALSYLDYAGKPGAPFSGKGNRKAAPAAPAAPELADVPADHRDPQPFALRESDVVAILGNGLADRMQHHGWMETILQKGTPSYELTFRNMSLSGDQVDLFPRSKGFTPMVDYLRLVKPTVVFCMFGYNESFEDDPAKYEERLAGLVKMIRGSKPGDQFPRIVLFSPIAHENLGDPNLPDGSENNIRLRKYTAATQRAAAANGVGFVDVFTPTEKLYAENDGPLTINGVHLNAEGYRLLGEVIGEAILGQTIAASEEALGAVRASVLDKNHKWHKRYRAVDGNDVWGGRSTLKFVNDQTNAEVLQRELIMLDVKTANRDPQIWARARGSELEVNDGNVPDPIPVESNVGGKSKSSNAAKEGSLDYMSAEESLAQMTLPDGFKANVFADESRFPQLINPVQMQVDTRGRLWVAAWPTYPKWEPLTEMNDALLIFTDDDGDGVADRCKEFARVHNPLGFEFWNGGVIVTSQPDILFLKDTDGDDVADERTILLQGVGSSDTHHAANNLIFGPDGGIYWQSGIFLQHNHEHPWGASLNTTASAMFRFDPRRHTIAFHAENRPNPHGTSFDRWGYLYASDGTGGRAYQVRPEGNGFKMHPLLDKEVRPVPANEIVSSANFPDEFQQNFLVCNAIGFLGIKNYRLHRDGYEFVEKQKQKNGGVKEVTRTFGVGEVWGTPEVEMLSSADKNFRPADAVFGEDGALYVADWQNVIIGHMQHNIRDPNRDNKHGRVFRVVYEKKPLQEPVAIDGEPLDRLMANLEHPIDGVRHRTRVELSERDSDEVIAACRKWLGGFDANNPDHAPHFLEGLWVHQQHNVRDTDLLKTVMASQNPHVANAGATVNHHWTVADPVLGTRSGVPVTEEEQVKPGGILSRSDDGVHVRIVTLVEQLKYDFIRFEVKPGQKVKVDFVNPDFMPHNIVFCRDKTGNEIAAAALAMGAAGFEAQFIPEHDGIVAYSSMLEHGQEESFEFTAPEEPGDHDFVCTFPGHAAVMRGILTVKK